MSGRDGWRRMDPHALWPGVRSIIMLGVNYGPTENPLELLGRRTHGAISVYAQGDDYHEVIKGRLKTLGGWLQSRFGGQLKVFVDTAPVMEKPLAAAAGIAGFVSAIRTQIAAQNEASLSSAQLAVALDRAAEQVPVDDLTPDPWKSTIPGVAHACGHDVHTAGLVGAGPDGAAADPAGLRTALDQLAATCRKLEAASLVVAWFGTLRGAGTPALIGHDIPSQIVKAGRRLDLLDPSPMDIEIEDIAHGLARVVLTADGRSLEVQVAALRAKRWMAHCPTPPMCAA